MENFGLIHKEGRLHVIVRIEGELYADDVTEYFEKENAHDEWLDYKLNLNNYRSESS